MVTRRQFTAWTPGLAAGPLALSGCSEVPAEDSYDAVADRTSQINAAAGDAPGPGDSSRGLELVRCATENRVRAARAHGLQGTAQFESAGDTVRVALEPTRAQTTPWFTAIAQRPCTRGADDGQPLTGNELALLQRAGRSAAVRLLLLLKRQLRNSAGFVVFVGQAAEKTHWVDVARCCERCALQATALGIRNASLNQPVEVVSVRPTFATALGLTDQRPDLVVRLGRGPSWPRSLRRPVAAVRV